MVFLTLNKRYFFAPIGYDEDFFTWGGWSIRKGLAPYRDFIEFKPPLLFITHALAQALFGFKNGGYRIFFAVFPLICLWALQISLSLRGIGRYLALTTVLSFLVLFLNPLWHDTALSDSESIGVYYYTIGLALLLWEGRHVRATTILGGFFMACCPMSKEPFAPMVVASWLALFWVRGGATRSLHDRMLYLRHSLFGVGALVLLLCLYMVPTGAMKAYIAMVRSYNVTYRDPARSYCVLLGVTHPTGSKLGDLAAGWERVRGSLVNEIALGYLSVLVVPGAVFALRRSMALFLMMIFVAIAAIWAPMAANCPWTHYNTMTMAGVLFVMVVGVDSMKGLLRAADPLVRGAAVTGALLMVVIHSQAEFSREWSTHYKRPPWGEPIPGVLAFVQQHTSPTDRIFTTGPPGLYVHANRLSATRESNFVDEILGSYEGKTDEERLQPIRTELMKNRPKVVVLDPENAYRKGRHYRALIMPFLADLHYQKINENLYLLP